MLKLIEQETDDDKPLIDTRVPPFVRVINGALDEDPTSASGMVLNGRIDPNTLRFLKVDSEYQRPLGNRADIFEALKAGVIVPNVDIGVRGQDFECDGADFIVKSPAFIIDGWQRTGTALQLLEQDPNFPLRIFGTFHFGTDALWERHRFTELNKNVKKVSPNLHLRNMRDQNRAVLTLFGLSNNTKDFALYHRVSWSQSMRRGELISALVLAKTVLQLHGHHTSLTAGSTDAVASGIEVAASKIGLDTFRKNTFTFFEVVDECWGIRSIEYRAASPQMKSMFLTQLARVFSHHLDFWTTGERVFFVPSSLRQKLAKFPINDPHVRSLAGSGGSAGYILYDLIVQHINSGKRTGHLRPRYAPGAKSA